MSETVTPRPLPQLHSPETADYPKRFHPLELRSPRRSEEHHFQHFIKANRDHSLELNSAHARKCGPKMGDPRLKIHFSSAQLLFWEAEFS